MRIREILLENWRQQVRSLDDILAHREDFIANPGVDSDLESMAIMHPEIDRMFNEDSDPAFMRAEWFDHVVRKLQGHSRQGFLTVYRMLAIQDVEAFIAATEAGHPLGSHWTYNDATATSSYHTGELPPGAREVLLVAEAPLSSVDWFATMQANFAHPYEQEVFVEGPVRLLLIDTDLNRRGGSYTPRRSSYET